MNEKEFKKTINKLDKKDYSLTYTYVRQLFSSNIIKPKDNFIQKIVNKFKGKPKTPKQIIADNFELILDKTDNEHIFPLLEFLLEKKRMKELVEENIKLILKKNLSNSDDLVSIYRMLNEHKLLENNTEFMLENGVPVTHLMVINQKIKGKSKENDNKINEYMKERKKEIAKEMLSKRVKCNEKLLNDYSTTVSIMIDELLKSEGLGYIDIESGTSGSYSDVYLIGNKVLKIGKPRTTYQIPNHRRILQPLVRTNLIDEENNTNIACIEISEKLKRVYIGKIGKEVLYDLYKELRKDGIIWTDVRADNVGELINENIPNLNNEEMYVSPNSVGFDKELKENENKLKPGDLVVLDIDYIYREDSQEILWPESGFGLEFERRYKRESNPDSEIGKEQESFESISLDEK
jgi:hypothetical protein